MATKSVTMTVGKIKSTYDLKGITTLKVVDKITTGVDAADLLPGFIKSIDASGNNLILNCEDAKGKFKVTLKNCTSLTSIKVSVNNTSYTYQGDEITSFIYDYKNEITKYNAKTLSVAGSYLNDVIDMSKSDYVAPATGKNKGKGLTIDGGKGSDTITGTNGKDIILGGSGSDHIWATAGNDTITGGTGSNVVHYSSTDFGKDTIKLTKGEVLNITGLDFEGIEKKDILKAGKNVNDLLITSKYGTVTLKDYYAKNTGATVYINGADLVNVTDKSAYLNTYKNLANTITGENTFNSDTKITTFTGSALADRMDARDMTARTNKKGVVKENKGLTINTGLGNDRIVATNFNDIINTGAGDDYIWSTAGDDTITGGNGTNTLYYYKSYGEFGDDTVNLTKGETLKIVALEQGEIDVKERYKVEKNDLLIKGNDGTITLKNYAMKNTGAIVTVNDVDLTSTAKIYFDESNIKKNVLTGSMLADNIDASAAPEQIVKKKAVNLTLNGGYGDDIITGSAFKDTINGGAGNDTINGSIGADKITGGKGTNTIKYSSVPQLDGDVITLTKGENLKIDISEIDDANVTYKIEGKNLLVSVNDGTVRKSFTIKDFGTKDVLTSSGSIKLITDNGTNDLKTQLVNSEVGTWHNDNIDRSDYKLYKNKKKTIIDETWTNKGLSINGEAGNDTIVGTNYSDTIKAGTGLLEVIEGGTGNDKLYGGTSVDSKTTFVINEGDGKDTIYSGKGEDTISFRDVLPSDLSFKTKGKNLVIGYNLDDNGNAANSVTIVDYYNKKGKITSSVKNIDFNGTSFTLEDFRSLCEKYTIISGTEKYLSGTSGDDYIIGAGTDGQTIYGEGGNDVVFAPNGGYPHVSLGDGDDIIYGGTPQPSGYSEYHVGNGNNTVYSKGHDYIILGQGNDEVHLTGPSQLWFTGSKDNPGTGFKNGGNDVIYFDTNSCSGYFRFYNTTYEDLYFIKEKDTKDLIIRYGENNSVTLKDYFEEGNENIGNFTLYYLTEYGKNSTGSKSLDSALIDKGGAKFIANGAEGTDENDYLIATDAKETINAKNGNDLVNSKGGDDNINLGGGNDVLLAGQGNKTINAVSGNNKIYLSTGNNNVTLGTGADTIISNTGENTISFIAGDTDNDIYTYNRGNDILEFKDDTLSQLSLDLTWKNPTVVRNGEITAELKNLDDLSTGVTIKDKDGKTSTLFELDTVIGVETADYEQTLITGSGNDIIYSGFKNDTINAGSGNNTINLIVKEIGNENTYTYANGTDTFVIDSIEDFSDLSLIKDGTNLVVAYVGSASSNTLIITDYYKENGDEVNAEMKNKLTFIPSDESNSATLAELITDKGIIASINGTEGPDVLNYSESETPVKVNGLGGNDTITGSNNGDFIVGGKGSDTIIDNGGNDTYVIDSADWGDGQDIITDNAGTDILRIDTTSDKINPFFDVVLNKDGEDKYIVENGLVSYSTGNDLYINSDNDYTLDNAMTSKGVKIVNYFNDDYKIENILIPNNGPWTDAVTEKTKNGIGQVVAQWLYNNGYNSVTEVINSNNDEKKAELVKLYKPIFGNSSSLYGTTGDDFIIGKSTGSQTIYGKGGNDIVVAPDGGYPWVDLGDGDDIIYGGTPQKQGYSEYHVGNGNNTVYSKGHDYIILGQGNDEVHLTGPSQVWFTGGRNEGRGFTNGGKDVVYFDTNSCSGYFRFYNTIYDDLYLTKSAESNDLIVRYGLNNTITMKDYFEEGHEFINSIQTYYLNRYGNINLSSRSINSLISDKEIKNYVNGSGVISGTEADEYLNGSDSNDTFTSNGNDVLNGGKGDDIYNVTSLTSSVGIFDSEGNDTLNISANKDDINVIFNIKKDGTFANGGDKLYLTDATTFDAWTTTGTLPTVGIKIEDSSSIEKIKTADNYELSDFDKLKSDVASWLTNAKNGAGYTDVADALASEDDVSTLVAIFENANWKKV